MNKNNVVLLVERIGKKLVAYDNKNTDWSTEVPYGTRRKAAEAGSALMRTVTSTGKVMWRRVDSKMFTPDIPEPVNTEVPESEKDIIAYIKDSYRLKPDGLIMGELKWKYLVRAAVRGKNILMTGYSGCGKTMAAKALVNSLDRPHFYFNLGATQDPRATLIGNTHFEKDKGTYFSESLFVKAIKTENSIILLDELSRAHPDAWNILMTVLDEGQRYLRLDEEDGQNTVKVADGVTFIATANIGNEFTSTRVMDRALLDRFVIVEMDLLDADKEEGLLKYMFPSVMNETLRAIAEISSATRKEVDTDNPRITSLISTRMSVEMSGLIYDGFDLGEAAEVAIYPFYDKAGGLDSERTYIKQLVQKYLGVGDDVKSDDDLFSTDDIETAKSNY